MTPSTASTAAPGPRADRRVDARLFIALVVGVLLAGYLALVVAAGRSDATFATTSYVVGDLVAGLAFAFGAAAATGPAAQRVLVALVGLAWLAGSVWPWALTLHQAVLVCALVAFPFGRPRGVFGWLIAAAAVLLAGQFLSQVAVVAVFAAVGVAQVVASRRASEWAYPTAAAALVAVALLHAWWTQRTGDLQPAWLYQSAVAAVGVAFAVATRAVVRTRRRLADDALRLSDRDDLSGLQLVLRRMLGDPKLTLVVEPFPSGEARDVAADHRLRVEAGPDTAWVASVSPALADPVIADAIVTAVRLTMAHSRLRAEEAGWFRELQASRTRLLAAVDRERATAARLLADEVVAPLTRARERLSSQADLAGIDEALTGLEEATADVSRIVSGAPPVDLGNGRITAALEALVARSGLPATLSVDHTVAADAVVETALFYVCAELLANAAKHAQATAVRVDLSTDTDAFVLTVHDDGRGGADPGGSGLTGLGDRVDVVGGSFVIRDGATGGTTAVARIPLLVQQS
jgi:signal transduction histidine kinase